MNWATMRPTSGDHDWRTPIGAPTNLPRDARLAALGQRGPGTGGEVDREQPGGAAVLAGQDRRGGAAVGQLTVERRADVGAAVPRQLAGNSATGVPPAAAILKTPSRPVQPGAA